MAELEDFEYQLLAQRGYAGGAATATAAGEVSSASTYVDPNDGTVYEWDEKQKGWVPKVGVLFSAHHISTPTHSASSAHLCVVKFGKGYQMGCCISAHHISLFL